jgi:hypothetical protein
MREGARARGSRARGNTDYAPRSDEHENGGRVVVRCDTRCPVDRVAGPPALDARRNGRSSCVRSASVAIGKSANRRARACGGFGRVLRIASVVFQSFANSAGATCLRLAGSRDEAYGVIRRGAATPPDAHRAAAMEANRWKTTRGSVVRPLVGDDRARPVAEKEVDAGGTRAAVRDPRRSGHQSPVRSVSPLRTP